MIAQGVGTYYVHRALAHQRRLKEKHASRRWSVIFCYWLLQQYTVDAGDGAISVTRDDRNHLVDEVDGENQIVIDDNPVALVLLAVEPTEFAGVSLVVPILRASNSTRGWASAGGTSG